MLVAPLAAGAGSGSRSTPRCRSSTRSSARAFEAFYTTKDVDAGTGLGLDIARRIVVERHHGDIAIDSRPGDTVAAGQASCIEDRGQRG